MMNQKEQTLAPDYAGNAIHANGLAETSGDGSPVLEDVASIDTRYGRILVQDGVYNGHPVRYYRQSDIYSSVTYLEDALKYELVFDYVKAYNRAFDYVPRLRSAMMIGGAAYQYPKYYISHYPGASMDVVEIDGNAAKIAKKYFFLDDLIRDYGTEKSGRLNLITGDGRAFLSETDKTYDAIFSDAFLGDMPARALASVEAVRSIRNHLNPGGVYMSNILGILRGTLQGKEHRFLRSELETMKQVFPHVYVFPAAEAMDNMEYGNYIALASDTALDVPDQMPYRVEEGDVILTDDYCPIEQLID